MRTLPPRYDTAARHLHWLTALLIVGMLALGLIMTADDILAGPARTLALHVHQSVGMIILGLGLVRLAWRLTHRSPPQSGLAGWERKVAAATHIALYGLLTALPFVGWMIISTLPRNALFFGLFAIPDLPLLHDLPNRKDVRELLEDIHAALAWSVASLALLHAAAALRHHFVKRDDVLLRMTPTSLERFLRSIRGGD